MSAPLEDLLAQLRARMGNPRGGLPKELFYFVSELTPLVNVDLLVKNRRGQTLLTWRHDEFYGPGWHVAGSIVRFKEKLEARIRAAAQAEFGAEVRFAPEPVCMREIMAPQRDVRGHFISLLYLCELTTPPRESLRCDGTPRSGQWKWHDRCPDDMISQHQGYRKYIDDTRPLPFPSSGNG